MEWLIVIVPLLGLMALTFGYVLGEPSPPPQVLPQTQHGRHDELIALAVSTWRQQGTERSNAIADELLRGEERRRTREGNF